MKILTKIRIFLFPVLGVICILFAEHVTRILPYLFGSAMVVSGVLRGIHYLKSKKYNEHQADELAYSVVLLIMGIAFILQGENSLGALGTTWAIIGIRKASKSLNRAIQLISQKKHFLAPILEFLVRITLALVLLFHPFEKFSAHVVILGLELLAISIRFSRSFPPKWEVSE